MNNDYISALMQDETYLYKNMTFGEFPDEQCAVTDNKGNHCNKLPVHTVEINGRLLGLCENCFKRYEYYDRERK